MPKRPYPPARNGTRVAPIMAPTPSPEPMADAMTPNLGLTQPEVGASASTWGYKLNANMGILDNTLPLSGGTISGVLGVTGTGAGAALDVGSYGINFTSYWGTHAIGFGWDGSELQAFVDNSYVGNLASQQWTQSVLGGYAPSSWVNANFATYSWCESSFLSGVTDPRYLFKGGDTCTGNLVVNGEVRGNAGVFADPGNDLGMWLSTNRYMQFAPEYYFMLDTSGGPNNGYLFYLSANNTVAQWRYDGTYVISGQAFKPGGGSWAASSDGRLKKDIADYTAGLDQVCALRPISYRYNGLGGSIESGRSYVGLVAQDARQHMPELVGEYMAKLRPEDEREDTILTLDPSAILYALINAVRELRDRVAELKEALHGKA